MQKIKGHHNLFKKDGAVVNTDMKAYEAAKKRKAEKQRLDLIEERLDRITDLLEKVLQK